MELLIGKTQAGSRFTLDANLLVKHAVVLGATGSGKTVLCKDIIEEAALKGVPTLAIDPKGDISGLALALPDLRFRPWCDAEAEGAKVPPEEHSRALAQRYSAGLADIGYSADDIRRFAASTEVRIYTPKSTVGLEVSISPRLEPPPRFGELMAEDPTLALDMVESTTLSLLRLVGYDEGAKKELSYLSQCLLHEWEKGSAPDVARLIDLASTPPFERMGSLSVDQFIAPKERAELASKLNLVLTLPGLKAWFMGEPLDFDRIFARGERTPVTVMDLRWINEAGERQFFVGMLTQELYKWLLKQGGTQTLRYLLYFDEVAGYLPSDPKDPPSKKGLRLLVKQARAFGLGCVFATQNPGDIDYMALSNINNRFVGNLKTRRDVEKVAVGMGMDVSDLAAKLSALKTRQFMFHNPDLGAPQLVAPRWLLTYHRGPLDPSEIKRLTEPLEAKAPPKPAKAEPPRRAAAGLSGLGESLLDPGVTAEGLLARFPLRETVAKAKQVKVVASPVLAATLSCSASQKLPGIARPFEEERTWPVTADLAAPGAAPSFEPLQGRELSGRGFADGMKAIASKAPYALERSEPRSDASAVLAAAREGAARELAGTVYYSPETGAVSKGDPAPVRSSLADRHSLDREGKASKLDDRLAKLRDETAFKRQKAESDVERHRADIAAVEKEVKALEAEAASKRKEGKPTAQLAAGVSTRQRRLSDLTAKVEAARRTIEMLDQRLEREGAAIERERELAERQFEQLLEREVKAAELRPSPDDVAVSQARVVWVPRTVEVAAEFPHRRGKREATVAYGMDGSGSAGPCEAQGCRTELTTESPGEVCSEGGELLCREHTVLCRSCEVPLCDAHAATCAACKERACPEHVWTCPQCKAVLCSDHERRSCAACKKGLCELCSASCSVCKREHCRDHLAACEVEGCELLVCSADRDGQRCKACKRLACAEHGRACALCKRVLCPDHALKCAACKRPLCKEDSWACPQCKAVVGSDHEKVACSACGLATCPVCALACAVCQKPLCRSHAAACSAQGCQARLCPEHAKDGACTYCGRPFCPEHLHPCPTCGKAVDEGCSVVLVRDLVRREKRCRNCTTQEMVAEARAKNVKLIVGLVAILALLLLIARWLSGAG